MSSSGLIGGVGAVVLAIVFTAFIGKTKGAERARRQMIMFIISGVICLVLGLVMLLTGGVSQKIVTTLIAVPLLLFGCTCLMIADIHRSIREIRNTQIKK